MKPCGEPGHGPQCGCGGKLNHTVKSGKTGIPDFDFTKFYYSKVFKSLKEFFNKHNNVGNLGPPKTGINYGDIEDNVMIHLANGCDVDICMELTKQYPFSFAQFRDSFFWLNSWLKDERLKASVEFRKFIVQSGAEYARVMAVDLIVGVRKNALYQEKRGRLKLWSKLVAKGL